MSVDRVPGVKMANSGAPVRERLSSSAESGAATLERAVAKQRAQRAAEMAASKDEARQRSGTPDAKPQDASRPPHLRLGALLGSLNAKIDAQFLAKDVVSRALRRRSMGLDDGDRPLRLLFAGPSGVGKTAMATALCEALLGSCVPDRNFKRFNLSEFSHPSKFNRLTGGDPNYVGYKEGGELTNFVRNAEERRASRLSGIQHTSCVLLLDEVDRAADGLLTFLMNFLDQGQLTSGSGETVDATRAVVLMTTNCGRDAIAASKGPCSPWDAAESARRRVAIVDKVKADVLRDICDGRYENLGRLDTIVPFLPLESGGRRKVIERQLEHVAQRLKDAGGVATLDGWSDQVMAHTLEHWDDDTGGRSTRDFIEENVVEAIAEALDEQELGTAADGTGETPSPTSLLLDVESDAASGHERVVCRTR